VGLIEVRVRDIGWIYGRDLGDLCGGHQMWSHEDSTVDFSYGIDKQVKSRLSNLARTSFILVLFS
jgi:hypothetical protein